LAWRARTATPARRRKTKRRGWCSALSINRPPLTGFGKHARALAARIKAHPAYTVALGSLLGIEGPQDTTDLTTSKPTLAGVDQTGGVVQLDCDKSISDGVNIYAKRDGDADFVFLARDTASPYIDNPDASGLAVGKPELREYKAVYVQSDAEIGLFSDEVVVNCAL
jgi:hypothetical protein